MRPSLALILTVLAMTGASLLGILYAGLPGDALVAVWGALLLAVLLDLGLSVPPRRVLAEVELPAQGFVGQSVPLSLRVGVRKGDLPDGIEARFDIDPEIAPDLGATDTLSLPRQEATTGLSLPLVPARRGQFALRAVALKWRSRLGFFDILTRIAAGRNLSAMPDVLPVLSGAVMTQMLPLTHGTKDMRLRGEGSEFHQLRDFQPGMDPRTVDWKRSARGRRMIARETRSERNHQVMLCLDSGRLMCERIGGIAKFDRAINAALAMTWAGGLAGDLVGLYTFDSQPRLFLAPAPGRAAFPRMRLACADLAYETRETNHTLGLTHLNGRLKRRSLVVVFSDFVDTTTAELLVENIAVMTRHHLVLYVALRDPALSALAAPAEITLDSMAQAVSAQQVLRERREVLERLARLGVLCLDTTPQDLTPGLVSRYIDIKARELI